MSGLPITPLSPQTDPGGIPIITATAIYITPSGPEAPVALPTSTPTLEGAPPSQGIVGSVPETTTPLEELPEGCYYEVQRGDSMFGIALANDLSLDALREVNPDVEPDELQIGQRLRLPTCISPQAPTATLPPGVTPTVTPSVSPTPTVPAGSVVYTVRSGDSVYAIATRFGTTVNAIVNANPRLQANPNLLSIGQELIIPVPATATPETAAIVQTATPPAASPIEPVTTPTRIGGG
jgi:LysM repeat protein